MHRASTGQGFQHGANLLIHLSSTHGDRHTRPGKHTKSELENHHLINQLFRKGQFSIAMLYYQRVTIQKPSIKMNVFGMGFKWGSGINGIQLIN